jgi:lipopolysaccharide biosynthesis protein
MRRFFGLPRGGRPLVLEAGQSEPRVEGVDHFATTGSLARVAVIAQWSPDCRLGRSVVELTAQLVNHDYQVVLVSTAPDCSALEWNGPKPDNITVLRRPNVGYDFGSWAVALHRYPSIAGAEHVLLLNDSLAGPFQPIDHLIEHFQASAADVWGLTDTSRYCRHLQSYCVGFKDGCLQEAPLARFWRGICVEESRDQVIWRNEIGLSRLLNRERYSIDVAISYRRVVHEGENPTILGWRRLLDLGFPFVKRELLRRPEIAPDGAMVREELRRRFGVEVDEWL